MLVVRKSEQAAYTQDMKYKIVRFNKKLGKLVTTAKCKRKKIKQGKSCGCTCFFLFQPHTQSLRLGEGGEIGPS